MTGFDFSQKSNQDRLNEECGVCGIYGLEKASHYIYLALFALQHRGQEAAGMVTFERGEKTTLHIQKEFGLVGDVFTEKDMNRLQGSSGVGHVRYSTQGGSLKENIQPFQFKTALGPVAIAHNGNLTNAKEIRKMLEETGSVFQSTSDTEVFVHLVARSQGQTMRDRIRDAVTQVKGAYSLAILTKEALYAVRDPYGFRPLVLGKMGEAWVVVSETCALDLMGAEYLRDVEPGEIVELNHSGLTSHPSNKNSEKAFCSFEPIYFARPDSLMYGENIYQVRIRIGEQLAKECPADADFVMAIPDSGVAMAEGFAKEAKLPLRTGLVRNHYIGRTFIQPDQSSRDFGVKLKLNPLRSVLEGKRVVVVDDSLVRGTTSRRIITMLREAGAKEIHFRIGAPPITHSCYYGVDTPKRQDLLAAQKSIPEIQKYLNADSIGYISLLGLKSALGEIPSCRFCTSCFTGDYPEKPV
jgi:amidophosphoribosyltransferase